MSTSAFPLAAAIRAKFPGAYDKVGDADLEQAILGKYPQYAPQANPASRIGVASQPAPQVNMQQSPLAPAEGTVNPFASGYGTGPGQGLVNKLNTPEAQAVMNVLTPEMAGAKALGGPLAKLLPESMAAAAAPRVAENALGVTAPVRSRAPNIGKAILENTHYINVDKLDPEITQAAAKITASMEDGVHQATQLGITGTPQAARQVLDQAIAKTPRNATELLDKLNSLYDKLHLGDPQQARYTPDDLLEMKRGVWKAVTKWGPKWQEDPDVIQTIKNMGGALDGELDRLTPGNAEKNDLIHNLIPAEKRAEIASAGATIGERILHRATVPTGALASMLAGGAFGKEQGGTKGEIIGGALGLVAPPIAASPSVRMAVARLLNEMGHSSLTPAMARILATFAANPQGQRPNAPDYSGANSAQR